MLPTPTGQPSLPTQLTGQDLSLTEVVNIIVNTYGAAEGANFLLWYNAAHKQDPALTPSQGAVVYLTGSTIANNLGGVISTEANLPGAAAAGANAAYKDIFGKFNVGNWFLRIGEILLGLVLVGVGLARITGTQNVISQIVKTKVPV